METTRDIQIYLNKKIAIFDGFKPSHGNFLKKDNITIHEADLKYHDDWNLIMPVVEKAILICDNNSLEEWDERLSESLRSFNIPTLIKELNLFIDFLDEQKILSIG